MMTYTAPDKHIIESLPYPQEVIYQSACSPIEYSDGIYRSEEIKGAPTEIGIQGIHITRIVDNSTMVIKIVEFSEQELIDYINNNKTLE
jgi:hypothetical protein